MKIQALYIRQTTAILRRIFAPYSTLTNRGHAFLFRQVLTIDPEMAYGADITVLPNWLLSDEAFARFREISQQRLFVYDLSDPRLLQVSRVLETLSCCGAITVPNSALAREVKIALQHTAGQRLPSIHILPSSLDVPFFMQAHQQQRRDLLFRRLLPNLEPQTPIIGCFGSQNWTLIQRSLEELRERAPKLRVIGDSGAVHVLGDLVLPTSDDMDLYPYLLQRCLFGLCPSSGIPGEDPFLAHEYGILCRPVIASSESAYRRETTARSVPSTGWTQAILHWLHDPQARAQAGQQAFTQARATRNTCQSKQLLQIMRQLLPHSILPV